MKHLREDLKIEYDRVVAKCPDMPNIGTNLINFSDVFRAYFILADYFMDSSSKLEEQEKMLVGIRSIDLLGSALGRQFVEYAGKKKYTEPLDICATLFFGLVKDHAFLDGNKRTALLILLYQLYLNKYLPTQQIGEFEKQVIAVAANELPKAYSLAWDRNKNEEDREVRTIAYILKKITGKKQHEFHAKPTLKEFVNALEVYGVTYKLLGNKLHLSREVKNRFKKDTFTYSLDFFGWTRVIGAGATRNTLEALDIYKDIPNYKTFFSGEEPFYSLVGLYEEPLRRLKDE